jgi:hypothetical protein
MVQQTSTAVITITTPRSASSTGSAPGLVTGVSKSAASASVSAGLGEDSKSGGGIGGSGLSLGAVSAAPLSQIQDRRKLSFRDSVRNSMGFRVRMWIEYTGRVVQHIMAVRDRLSLMDQTLTPPTLCLL